MNNSTVVPKKSSFMIEDILRSTHDTQYKTLTKDHSSTVSENPEISITERHSPREITHPQSAHTFLSDVQKDVLLQAFAIQPRPSKEQLTQLAEHLDLKVDRVRRWFSSRRGREKKKHYKELRDLEALASSLSSSKQPIIQAQPVRSCSYYGYPASVPSFCRNSSPYRNRGLVPRNMVGPMPVYRHPPQQSRVNTGSKQPLPGYQTTHDLRHSSLIQLNTGSLPYSLPRPVHHQRVPVYQFRV